MKSTWTVAIAVLALLPLPAGPAMAQAAASADGSAALKPYRIQPGDELEVFVWGEERLQRVVKVLPDGNFSFPLVGRVDALNKLPSDIETAITAGLKSQYRDQVPQVTVSVRATTGMQVFVIGKVKTPGAIMPGRYINVLQALVMAGGPADFADTGAVTIFRSRGGRSEATRIRLTDFLKGTASARDLAALPVLESGDTVVVP